MSAFMLDQTRQNIGGVLVRVEHVKPQALNQHQLQRSSTCKACKQSQSNQLLLPMAVFLSAILGLVRGQSCWTQGVADFFCWMSLFCSLPGSFLFAGLHQEQLAQSCQGYWLFEMSNSHVSDPLTQWNSAKQLSPFWLGKDGIYIWITSEEVNNNISTWKRHIGREARTQTGHSHSHRTFSKLQTILTFHVDKIHLILESFRKCTNLLDFLKHCIPMMAWRFRIQLLSFPFIIGIHPGCFKFSISGSEKLGRLFANGWRKLMEYLLFI